MCKPGAAGAPEILIQRVLDEPMGEREALRSLRALLQERRRDRLIQQVEQPLLGELEHREQQLEVELAADDRSRAQRRPRIWAQALDSPPDDLAHALGQAQLGQVSHQAPATALLLRDRAGLRQMAQHLTGKERVARRLTRDLRRERPPILVELVPRRRFHQRQHILRVQAGELDSLHSLLAVKGGQQRRQRMLMREIGVTVGTHHHH